MFEHIAFHLLFKFNRKSRMKCRVSFLLIYHNLQCSKKQDYTLISESVLCLPSLTAGTIAMEKKRQSKQFILVFEHELNTLERWHDNEERLATDYCGYHQLGTKKCLTVLLSLALTLALALDQFKIKTHNQWWLPIFSFDKPKAQGFPVSRGA